MPERVTLRPGAPVADSQTFRLEVPRRGDVLASLRAGQRLEVQVLERFASGKVLLSVKGAAVTAKAQGDFPVGAKFAVVVDREGGAYVLRQVAATETPVDTLARLVRGRWAALAGKDLALTRLMRWQPWADLAQNKSSLASLVQRLGAGLGNLLDAESGLATKLEQLAAMWGLVPVRGGDRVRAALGASPSALLERLAAATPGERAELAATGALSAETAKELSDLAAMVRDQIGLMRGLNALLEARDMPVYFALPFAWGGEQQPTELWVYKNRDMERDSKDEDATSVLIRLRLSALGEVRALVVVRESTAQVRLFAETDQAAAVLRDATEELTEGLRAAGLTPAVSVRQGLSERPMPEVEQLLVSAADRGTVSVRA